MSVRAQIAVTVLALGLTYALCVAGSLRTQDAAMSNKSNDWLTPLQQGAAQIHELFTAYVAVGFTREEALKLVTVTLAQASHGGSQ